jgi:hypothetical protein
MSCEPAACGVAVVDLEFGQLALELRAVCGLLPAQQARSSIEVADVPGSGPTRTRPFGRKAQYLFALQVEHDLAPDPVRMDGHTLDGQDVPDRLAGLRYIFVVHLGDRSRAA